MKANIERSLSVSLLLTIFGACGCGSSDPTEEYRASMVKQDAWLERRHAYQAQHNQKVEVLDVRILPRQGVDGQRLNEVLVDWHHSGTEPIEEIIADITVYDSTGQVTMNDPGDGVYFSEASEGTKPISPGSTYQQPQGQGQFVTGVDAGEPHHAEVKITYAGPHFPEPLD